MGQRHSCSAARAGAVLRGLRAACVAAGASAALLAASCSGDEPDLVVYTSLNQVHSEPVIRRFEQQSGLRVRVEYDVEANKTVGLARRLREEAAGGVHRCDVFWNNEIANTVALAHEGLFQGYRSPAAEGIDPGWFGPGDLYTGFAGRGRVVVVDTRQVDPATPLGLEDLFDPRWQGRSAFVRPLAGTTLTHIAILYTALGDEAGRDFARRLREANRAGDLRLYPGNMVLARAVGEGESAWGFTDTNDVEVMRKAGAPVAQVIPDQGEDGMGMILLPNTVAILAGAPHPDVARRFVDYLVSAENERFLAETNAQIPFHPGVERPPHVIDPAQVRLMPVDFEAVGRNLPRVQAELQELFLD